MSWSESLRPAVLLALILAAPSWGRDPAITALAFTPEGKVVAGSQSGVRLCSFPDLKNEQKWADVPPHVHDLTFSPNGRMLAIAGGSPADSGMVQLRRWPSMELLKQWRGQEDVVHAVCWSPDGSRIAWASADGTCGVRAVEGGGDGITFRGHAGTVRALCFLPDGQSIVSAGDDQGLRVWETRTGKSLRILENHTGAVQALALRPGQPREQLALVASAGSDRTVRFWQPSIGRMMRFRKLPAPVLSLAWAADGSRLAAGCTDGQVYLLDPEELSIVRQERLQTGWLFSLGVSAKGDLLAGGENGILTRLAR